MTYCVVRERCCTVWTYTYSQLLFSKKGQKGLVARVLWLGVPSSKPLGRSMVDSAFHPFKVKQMSTRKPWGFGIKKIAPRNGCLALGQLNTIKRGHSFLRNKMQQKQWWFLKKELDWISQKILNEKNIDKNKNKKNFFAVSINSIGKMVW